MTTTTDTELDRQAGKFIFDFVVDRHTCQIGLLPCTYCEAKAQLKQIIARERQNALEDVGAIGADYSDSQDTEYRDAVEGYIISQRRTLQAQADKEEHEQSK